MISWNEDTRTLLKNRIEKYFVKYEGNKAKELGAFYTPPILCVEIATKANEYNGKKVLDPTCGYGVLLITALECKVLDGEEPSNAIKEVYGIELVEENRDRCLEVLRKWCEDYRVSYDEELLKSHIKIGNALVEDTYQFNKGYSFGSYSKQDIILANPPYNIGNNIMLEAKKHSKKTICLMPLSRYKFKGLYKFIDTIDFISGGRKMFGAYVQENLCITTFKEKPDNSKDWLSIEWESFDSKYSDYYRYNNEHFVNIKPITSIDNITINETDFIESIRSCGSNNGNGFAPKRMTEGTTVLDTDLVEIIKCVNTEGGGAFRKIEDIDDNKGGWGYRRNIYGEEYINNNWGFIIRLHTKRAFRNFCIWWYQGKKGKSLSSKGLLGMRKYVVSSICYLAIPQIDWEHIDTTDLWKQGKYDEAVLDVMGLKWNDNRDGVVCL